MPPAFCRFTALSRRQGDAALKALEQTRCDVFWKEGMERPQHGIHGYAHHASPSNILKDSSKRPAGEWGVGYFSSHQFSLRAYV